MRLLKTSWRNLWRNPRRTLITMSAVTLNTAVLIATYALIDGMMVGAVSNITNVVIGEAQAHAPEYLSDRSLYKTVEGADQILSAADSLGVGAAPRMYGYGLIAHGSKSAGALFWGVEPELERKAFDLPLHLLEGEFLSSEYVRGMVIGRKLAKSLNVQIGSEVVVVVQGADGSLGNDLYTISGIIKTVSDGIDRGAALMNSRDFRELYVYSGEPHEIAFNSRAALSTDELSARIASLSPVNEIKTWQELLPFLADMVDVFDVMMLVFGAIFFLAAGLGVTNTMLMSTFERIPEFGMRKALGESPFRILLSVITEALLLSLVAALVGAVIGALGSWWLEVNGIDTSSFASAYTISGVAFDPYWRAVVRLNSILIPSLTIIITCAVATLYPALIAARLDPVKAMSRV